MTTKTCSKCKEELPIEMFYPDKDKWDGYKTECKDCTKQYYEKRKERKWLRDGQYYGGRANRMKKDWKLLKGRYYRYREYFEQPSEKAIIFKVLSTKIVGDKFIFTFQPLKPKDMEDAQWVVSRVDLYWAWKWEHLTKDRVEEELGKQD